MLKYSHPVLAQILDYWPVTIFMPAILLLIAALALVTRWWDRRDQAARESVQQTASAADVVGIWETGRRRPTSGPRAAQQLDGDHDVWAAS